MLRSIVRRCYGCLCLLHLCSLHLFMLQEAHATNHASAFFNASLDSQVNISSVLNFRSQLLFSFRTCSSGRLIHQTGPSNNNQTGPSSNNQTDLSSNNQTGPSNNGFFLMRLTRNGSLVINWRSVSVEVTDSVEVANLSLTTNEWFTIEMSFSLGQVLLLVEQGPLVRRSVVLANSTYRSYLWNLNLTGGSPLEVGGGGFTGCIQQGPQVLLSSPSAVAVEVAWDVCPLENSVGCESSAVANPCWSYPCLNDGSCVYLGSGSSFSCQCLRPYNGSRCEIDLSSRGCELNPCQNNGTCESTNVTMASQPYLCICAAGFTGRDCGTNKNECASSPCRNGGQCIDGINSFTCLCTNTGYTGALCQTDIDECQTGLVSCQNGAICLNTPGSYKCICTLGFTGTNCQMQSDDCQSNPCQNSGTCSRSSLGGYGCNCSLGFTGVNCEVNIDDCVGVVCSGNHTQCVDGINSFTCQCIPGFRDVNSALDNITSCEDINECISHPCANGSTCVNGLNEYRCQCQAGFTGRQCQTDINECLSTLCQNGGTCDDLIGGYRCHCPIGFTDSNCSTDIDECQSRPCQNGATCINLVGRFQCNCSSGWLGETCQQDIDECGSSPCLNGATCNNLVNHYICTCPIGYTGTNCGVDINDCHESSCLSNGTCIDGVNQFTCQCTDEWMGYNCSLVYDACVMNVCQNNGTCQSLPPSHNYTCQCAPGFTGHDCQQNIDDCQNKSCLAYQVCVDGVNSYSCTCPPGMTGLMCETDIDECGSDPCLNGATCVDGKGNFSCQCVQEIVNLTAYTADPKSVFRLGYAGLKCERLLDACSYRQPSICINDGTCNHSNASDSFGFRCSCPSLVGRYYTGRNCELTTDPCHLAGSGVCFSGGSCESVGDKFICHCAPGYRGDRCQTEINECESNPCRYNGSCQDAVNRYTCQCTPGTTGVNCETNIDECASMPCMNDGQCVDLINAYKCNCSDTGFEGVHCETDIDECQSDPCQHNATCENARNMYNCSCYPGYTGINCEMDIDECFSSPCQHNSTCIERSISSRTNFSFASAAGFDCVCPAGITGVQCEVDINECFSYPCSHGDCVDLVNGYICHCLRGYRGVECKEEIDECKEYEPCADGATCLDRVADYECVCALGIDGKVFGGKNCSVELIGCRNNLCASGATCEPFLSNELDNVHDYHCLCSPGFSGRLCNISTSVSFDSNSWLAFHLEDNVSDVLSLSFDFRTTLSDFTLFLLRSSNQSLDDFRLDLAGVAPPRLRLSSSRLLNGFLVVEYPGLETLNDANWHGIQMNLTSSDVSLQISECTAGANCSSAASLLSKSSPYIEGGVVYFGGNNSNAIVSTFVGCMRDVEVNGGTFLPGVEPTDGIRQTFAPHEVGLGCLREDQCNPDPCSGQGKCSDLWTNYKCDCRRPFWGRNCSGRFPAATFGYNDVDSLAEFNISASELSRQLEGFLDVSFFLRTRQSNGLLFYVGTGTMDSSQPNTTYIAMQLNEGQLMARIKLRDVELSFQGPSDDLSDGQQHFVQLLRNDSLLRFVIDSNSLDFALNDSRPLTASVIFVGGVPSGQGRRRRQSEVMPQVIPLRGTMVDVRVNGVSLVIVVVNRTDESSSPAQTLAPSRLMNVKEGEVTSEVCRIQQPCENNATCNDVFFNDFYCNCSDGFRGRNCSQLNFCVHNNCPPGGSCQNLDDGIECISNATLNGVSSYLRYSTTINQLDLRGISAIVRTRNQTGTILQLHPGSSSTVCSAFLELSNGEILLRFNTTSGDQQNQQEHRLRAMSTNGSVISDGTLHAINVTFVGSEEVLLSVDGVVARLNYSNAQTVSSRCNSSSGYLEALVGLMRQDLEGSLDDFLESGFFKGCLSEVRVNGVLLPFFDKSQLMNRTAKQRFDLEESRDVQIGCSGDDVCGEQTNQCRNNGRCEDLWNAFSCHCTPGFTGLTCSQNINDCLSNQCLNGATCVDGIVNYTCNCNQGYTGFRCETDINECSSNPCLHSGTCTDRINEYSCSCSSDYVGQRCQMPAVEDCRQVSCLNGATCVTQPSGEDGLEMWKCSCEPGYTGLRCETMVELCANNTCAVGTSTCQPMPQTLNYTCVCHPGHTGRTCSEDIDECITLEPCLNGGNCSNNPGSYVCLCPTDWNGPRCDAPSKSVGGLKPYEIGIIVGVIGGIALVAAVIAIIVFLCIARKKRATHGTYSPSRQEMAGSRVDMRSALKLPPEERLI